MLSRFGDYVAKGESFGCIGCGLKILFQPSRHRWALVYLACIARFRSRTKL